MRRQGQRGFTLIELLIVVMMVMILASVAAPRYAQSIVRAKETVLRNNLHSLRSAIDQYSLDKQRAPQSLDELVSAGYFRELPSDPFTQSNGTWQVVMEDYYNSIDQTQPGITDVHSGSDLNALDGTPYSSW